MRLPIAAIWLCLSSLPAFSLGFPIPQEKPCLLYWNSKVWHEKIAKDPRTQAYLASPHEIIARDKSGNGTLITHDKKGCLVIQRLSRRQVEKLLTDQEGA